MAAFNIDLEVLKKMPPGKKALIIGAAYLLLAAAYYFLVLQASFEKIGSLETKLSELQTQVTEKERLASQKNRYIREVSALQETLKAALTKLPDQREIPGLLYSVAQSGRDSGIEFLLFEPKQAEKKPEAQPAKPGAQPAKPGEKKPGDDKGAAAAKPGEEKFYDEIPVRVMVTGSFHSMAIFFEKVARLPRIINIEEIVMSLTEGKAVKQQGSQAKQEEWTRDRIRYINTSCVVKTYMFLEKLGEKKADGKK